MKTCSRFLGIETRIIVARAVKLVEVSQETQDDNARGTQHYILGYLARNVTLQRANGKVLRLMREVLSPASPLVPFIQFFDIALYAMNEVKR